MNDIDHALAAFEDSSRRFQNTAPNLEAQAELNAIQLIATCALTFAPDATHMLIESSDQGDFMCAPHSLERDGVALLEVVDGDRTREEEWEEVVDQYDLNGASSWLTWGHDAWERFIDRDHPYTFARSGYLAMDLRKIKLTL